jgi:hypothetical protein
MSTGPATAVSASTRPRKSAERQENRAAATRRKELERGLSFTDDDGVRIVVRVMDVKGSHDKALMEAMGLDFVGLLRTMSERQGTDLLAAVIWFGRLVNGRSSKTYDETLDEVSYSDYVTRDFDQAKAGEHPPEA